VLDRVLVDRLVSRHEEDELVAVANMMELSRDEALGLHRLYLDGLGRLALADGLVTKDERSELNAVANMLGLTTADVEASLNRPAMEACDAPSVGGFVLKTGDAVVFTGEASGIDRANIEMQARAIGLRVTSAVSRKTHLLVAADPDSISGKARKARELGIPIVGYAAYLGMLDAVAT
jgi:DNA polymerase-3 subunit epsilon